MRCQFLKLFKIFLFFTFFLIAVPAFAYQTVAMDFVGLWYKMNYINNERDAIVHYVRQGYNKDTWSESIVFHTFKWTKESGMSARELMQSLLAEVRKKNSSLKVEYVKKHEEDMIVSWCVDKNELMDAHCEILRTTQSFEGALSIHYINKNPKDFLYVKQDWLNKIRKARIYQSYFRQDRILNKALTFEL